jgi:hypothetical protein
MTPNQKISEGLALLAKISPVSQGAGTATSGWVYVGNHHQLMATILVGVLGTAATVDAKIQQATDSSGTSAKDVANKSITQLVKASNDNNEAVINFRASDLDQANAFCYVRVSVTVGTAASLIAATLHGAPRFEDASALNDATVVQVV